MQVNFLYRAFFAARANHRPTRQHQPPKKALAIIYLLLSYTPDSFLLTGGEVCLAIVSTYLLAFVQAGASVFNQIEHWSVMKSLFCHFSLIYAAYSLCYIINTWIPFEPMVLLIFTVLFVAAYLIIWLTVYVCVNATRRRLNAKL